MVKSRIWGAETPGPIATKVCVSGAVQQWRRAIEALEARAPPDGVATLVNSLQNRVKSITLCVILNAKNGK